MRNDQADPSTMIMSAELETRYKSVGMRAVAAAAPYCAGNTRNAASSAPRERDEHDFGPLGAD